MNEESYNVELLLELYENDEKESESDILQDMSDETRKLLLRSLCIKASFESSHKHNDLLSISKLAEL